VLRNGKGDNLRRRFMKRGIIFIVVIISTFWGFAPARAAGSGTSEEIDWKRLISGKKRYVACKKPDGYIAEFVQLPEQWIAWSKAESRTIKVKVKTPALSPGQSWPVGDSVTFDAVEVEDGAPTLSPSSHTAQPCGSSPQIYVAQSIITMPHGPGKFKIKASWTAGDYSWTKTHPTEINFVGAKFEKDDGQSYGWDDHDYPPWVSCEQSKGSKVRLVITPSSAVTASKVVVKPGGSSYTPTLSSPGANQLVAGQTPLSVSFTASATANQTDVIEAHAYNLLGNTGAGAILKYLDGATEREAKVCVATYKPATINVFIHKTFNTAPGFTIAEVNKILKQAVLTANDVTPAGHQCPTTFIYPTNGTVHIDNDDERADLYEKCHGATGQGIYVLKVGSNPDASDATVPGNHSDTSAGGINFVQSTAAEGVVAHELLHTYLNSEISGKADAKGHDISCPDDCAGNVMKAETTQDDRHMRLYQWNKVTR
jgi:hypothetical protein